MKATAVGQSTRSSSCLALRLRSGKGLAWLGRGTSPRPTDRETDGRPTTGPSRKSFQKLDTEINGYFGKEVYFSVKDGLSLIKGSSYTLP